MRYQICEGKELTEIGEMMCDHCLAPDTTSGAGIGCDNMTVLIVAITHGLSKEGWYEWIKDRVKNGYGYKTPNTWPQIYAQSRLLSFKARREAQEARDRAKESSTPSSETKPTFDSDEFLRRYGITVTTVTIGDGGSGSGDGGSGGSGGDGGGGGGISYHPGGDIVNDSGQIMFGKDDSGEEDSGDEEPASTRSFFAQTLGLGRLDSPDPAKNLREQLAEFEKENEINPEDIDADGDAKMHDIHENRLGECFLPVNFRNICSHLCLSLKKSPRKRCRHQ